MLSFFSKKKQSLETPEFIQGSDSQTNNDGDDFIFVEKKPTDAGPSQIAPLYPPVPPGFGSANLPYPGYNHPAARADNTNNLPVPYVQGVPFELSPHLCSKTTFDITQLQVDGILAYMTRQMSVEEDYNFALERSIQDECAD